jgi:hypothetical protein
VNIPGVEEVAKTTNQEQILFYCHAFGLKCHVSPGPAPGPSPGPSAPVSAACKEEIDAKCAAAEGDETKCKGCIRENAHDFVAHGCPPAGEQGEERCTAYCTSK